MGKLRSRSDGEIHAPGNAVAVHRLHDVGVNCSTHGGEVESLVAISHCHLVLGIQGPVIPELYGFFTAPNEGNVRWDSSYGGEVPVEMYDPVPSGECHGRFRTQILDEVGQC